MNIPARFKREKFCSDIRAERSRAHLSQAEVGQKFGVSGVTISKWENGRYIFTAERFLALCLFFNLEPLNYIDTASQKAVSSEAPKSRYQMQVEHVERDEHFIAECDRIDLENDLPVGYTREQRDLYDYYKLDREMGY